MKNEWHSNQEEKAVDALIVAGLLQDPGSEQDFDLTADAAELSLADRARLDSLPDDFVQHITERGWVCHSEKSRDDTSDGDVPVLDRAID